MSLELEKDKLMYKLASAKRNWGAKYDRLEHYSKRFQNLKLIIKELVNLGWIIFYKKPNYQAISLNPQFKSEIIKFIEDKMPNLKGVIR